MSLANCKHCGHLYIRQRSSYCANCQELHDRYYTKMRNYLKSNPRSTVFDIHENTGIPLSKVLEISNDAYVPFVH